MTKSKTNSKLNSPLRLKVVRLASATAVCWLLSLFFSVPFEREALALDLDWGGQFWSEEHAVGQYQFAPAATGSAASSETSAYFQTLFFRLRPRVIVNDNVSLKSEWWLGSPSFGFFGDGRPSNTQASNSFERNFNSTASSGVGISAQRFWLEMLTDVGTLQVGRAPLNWGLGIVWNSGDQVWDRFASTGDVIRLVSKFGPFGLTPSVIKYSKGASVVSGGALSDFSIALKYENPDEDFEGGVNFIRRLADSKNSDFRVLSSVNADNFGNFAYNTWDLYAKKRFGRFSIGAEAPIVSGNLGSLEYSTYALAFEGQWKISDTFETSLRAGHVPGQSGTDARVRLFSLHPNYHLGKILFNYNPSFFGRANASPFDASISNANYFSLEGAYKTDRWRWSLGTVFGNAPQTAEVGKRYYDSANRGLSAGNASLTQESSLGFELDAGALYQWDQNLALRAGLGAFFPGGYFKFDETTGNARDVKTVLAGTVGLGLSF